MGAVVMNGATIGDGSLIAAGAVVLEGADIPPRSLVAGVPAKVIRPVSDAEAAQRYSTTHEAIPRLHSSIR
jgi:acetyltransferase-like isoleucine patch superfamily enzyme